MQPICRRATFTQPVKMLFSASSIACTSTMPNTVTARDRQHRMRAPLARRTERLPAGRGRVDDAVADAERDRVEPHFVLGDPDRADDAVLDASRRPHVGQLEARLGRAAAARSRNRCAQPGTSVQWRIDHVAPQRPPGADAVAAGLAHASAGR